MGCEAVKALSILQPWATLIAIGAKHIETRSWATAYRGDLAIHASKAFPVSERELCHDEPFAAPLKKAYPLSGYEKYRHYSMSRWSVYVAVDSELPLGAIIAIATLVECEPTPQRLPAWLSDKELAFGDFSKGRYMWRVDNVRRLAVPIPARGSLGIWEWQVPEGMELL